jgi:putative ABC transport system permease protein
VVGASGILSLLIGTFTIVNSMVVSVQERRREIGLKKALGAEDGHILGEVVAEAILIAGLGGVLGVLGSAMAGAIANPLLMGKLGSRLFLLTPRLSLGTVAFSVVMGVIAGLFPAWRAARLDPVIALRGGGGALYAGRGFKRLVYLIRRNARSILTVGGIAIGIFALVLLGSLTEALNSYIHDVDAATNDLLLVSPESSDVPMGRSTARVLKRLPGVVDVILTNTAELPTNFTGAEDGEEIKTRFWAHESETGDLGMSMPVRNEIAQGRMVAPGSTDEVVLGAGLAETHHLRVGDTIRIQRREFKVVGIWRRIAFDIGGHDMSTFITIAALERILNQSSGIGAVAVRAVSPETAQALRETIETELPGLTVQTTGEVLGEIQRIFAGLIAVMGGIFSIAVFVGGVSVINTMVIAVNERTREIGLKKALGAEDGDILAEVLLDAAKLGALGGVLGNALAWIAVLLINPLLKAHAGLDMLNLSPRLALAAAVFSLLLGMGAGFLPARRAARLDPVIALRTE